MHPGFHGWWRARHCGGDARAHADERHGHGHGWHGPGGFHGAWAAPGFDEGGALGVRRPLRFLAYKLDLGEEQVAAFAAILDALKTERAQSAVDQRRRISALAEAVEGASVDEARLEVVGQEQQRTEQRMHDAVARALKAMHAALDDEQRRKLAYLLRTGALTL